MLSRRGLSALASGSALALLSGSQASSMDAKPTGYSDKLFDVRGRVAIVTGSTKGLGKSMASALYCSGATVVINGRDDKRTKDAALAIEQEARDMGLRDPGILVPIAGDVSVEATAKGLVAEVVKKCSSPQ